MVDRICAKFGLELIETGVGFKYIAAEMIRGDVLLGFEESGGIGFPGHIPERDGILAGLMLLEMLAREKKPLKTLIPTCTTPPSRVGQLALFSRKCAAESMVFDIAPPNCPSRVVTSSTDLIELSRSGAFAIRREACSVAAGSSDQIMNDRKTAKTAITAKIASGLFSFSLRSIKCTTGSSPSARKMARAT
jgi:hypothetical protein